MASRNVLLASAGYDTTIRFWDISGGHTKRTLKYDDNPELKVKMPVNSITFSPDGALLAACSVKSFKLFETESERQSPKFSNPEAHKASVNKIGFNREGKWIYTAGDDRCCKLWDIRTNVCTNSVESRGGINGCMLHPNQKEIVMADECGYVRVWDIVAGRFRVEMCPDDNVPLHAMTISHDGETLVACSKKGNVYVWKYSDSYIQPQFMFHAHDDFILACSISPNNKILATASADRSIKLWDADSFELSSKLIGHEKYVWDCCFSCDSKNLVSCSSDNTCRLWDIKSGRIVRHYTGHEKVVACVALYERIWFLCYVQLNRIVIIEEHIIITLVHLQYSCFLFCLL